MPKPMGATIEANSRIVAGIVPYISGVLKVREATSADRYVVRKIVTSNDDLALLNDESLTSGIL